MFSYIDFNKHLRIENTAENTRCRDSCSPNFCFGCIDIAFLISKSSRYDRKAVNTDVQILWSLGLLYIIMCQASTLPGMGQF